MSVATRSSAWWRARVAANPDRLALLWLFGVFAASRVGYRIAGVRFDESSTFQSFQVIDEQLLRDDFFSSVWHFHAQPPLFNLLIGLLMRVPGPAYAAFAFAYLVLGVALTAALFLLQRELGVSRLFAAIVTALFVVSPAVVLYENYFFYTYPVAVALCAAMLFLARFLRTGRLRNGVVAFSLLAGVALTRASFHLVWLALIVAIVAVALHGQGWKVALVAGSVPLLVVAGWYAKQYDEFGTFSSSSWLGMNLARVAFHDVPDSEIERFVDDGTLSKQALLPAFGLPAEYGFTEDGHSGIKVLDQRAKQPRVANFGFEGYLDVSQQFQDDALAFMRERPKRYLQNVGYASRFFVLPASDYPYLAPNWQPVRRVAEAYDHLFFAQRSPYSAFLPRPYPDLAHTGPQLKIVPWGLVAMYAVALAVGPAVMVRRRRARYRAFTHAQAVTMFVISLTVGYAVLVDTLLELGENNRFRFETDPLVCALVAVAVTSAARWWRDRQEAGATSIRTSPLPST
jgi:hypothetical protein